MVTLKNLTKRPLVLHLPHEQVCSETECLCQRQKVGVVDHNPKTGDRALRAHKKRVPHTVTLFPRGSRSGDTSEPLPNRAERAPEVRDAIRRRDVELTLLTEEQAVELADARKHAVQRRVAAAAEAAATAAAAGELAAETPESPPEAPNLPPVLDPHLTSGSYEPETTDPVEE